MLTQARSDCGVDIIYIIYISFDLSRELQVHLNKYSMYCGSCTVKMMEKMRLIYTVCW